MIQTKKSRIKLTANTFATIETSVSGKCLSTSELLGGRTSQWRVPERRCKNCPLNPGAIDWGVEFPLRTFSLEALDLGGDAPRGPCEGSANALCCGARTFV